MTENANAARLRETGAEFTRVRGLLQSAEGFAVVNASPATRSRLGAMHKRAALLQKAIEKTGGMIDGARKWFADTFGKTVESAVPLANPAIDAAVQTSIVGMNYFLKDAKAELDRIIGLQKQYEALPADKKDSALAELRAESTPVATPAIPAKWVWIGLALAGAFVWWKGGESE